MDKEKETEYWSKILDIPVKQFNKRCAICRFLREVYATLLEQCHKVLDHFNGLIFLDEMLNHAIHDQPSNVI